MQIAEAAELRKYERVRERALDQKMVQTQQLDELKTRILSERAEGMREGVMLKQRAAEETAETRQKEINR